MIQIEKHNEYSIKISFPYNHEFINRIKTIKGRKWHPEEKCWTVPNNNETIKQILKLFEKENLQIDQDLGFAQINYDFSDLKNLKHKTILMTVYSAGLRVSELVKLKPEDIDQDRMLIFVKYSKGRKDRQTVLSAKTYAIIQLYKKEYNPTK